MASNKTTTRGLTDMEKTLFRLATRKSGVTRPEARKALGYEDGANVAIQTMLKIVAAKRGMQLVTDEEVPSGNGGRWLSVYAIRPTSSVALKTKRSGRKSA